MSPQLFMARQPILDAEKNVYAYEIFYRDEEGHADFSDPRLATSSVLVNLLNQVGLKGSVGSAKAFINVGANILLTEIIFSLPCEKFVFELNENMLVTHQIREVIRNLHYLGYHFALDNANCTDSYVKNFAPIMAYIEYVKFDTTMTDMEFLGKKFEVYVGKKFIAQRVEIPEVFEAYKEIGFHYFQGYFFAKPSLIRHNRIDPKHKGVIQIFNMLQTDAPMKEITKEFEKDNELTLQLLQFLNSTSMFDMKEKSSIADIINLVGKPKLLQWLLLIIYSKSGKDTKSAKSPLSLLAQHRVEIMLGILKKLPHEEFQKYSEEVRYIAMLSLLESVFNVPLPYILESFGVDKEIESALLTHSGVSGRLLAIALSIEKADFAATQILLKTFELNVDDLDTAMLESFINVSTL